MDIQRCFRKGVLSLIAVASAAISMALLQGPMPLYAAEDAAEPHAPQMLTRTHDPVIIKGSSIGALTNKPTNQLFVYAWKTNTWVQIPFQIDEVNEDGEYVATEDGIFDSNDEVVVMVKDAGDKPPSGESPGDALSLSTPWYAIKITDPVQTGEEAWIYVVQSSVLVKTFTDDYVDFAPLTHQIQGENFTLQYATPKAYADRLTLGGSLINILDRNKINLCGNIAAFCVDEEANLLNVPQNDGFIKDGPVRLIIRSGRVQAYGTMISWTNQFTLPTTLQKSVQFSLDFLPAVDGANFFNAAVPNGVVVDGSPDTVPGTPFSPWFQMSTDFGTLIQVTDASKLTGTPSNVYIDNNALDLQDTGDRRHWGEAGILLEDPGPFIEYNFNLYMLEDKQPSLGTTFTDYYEQPLAIQATLVSPGNGSTYTLYTPIVK